MPLNALLRQFLTLLVPVLYLCACSADEPESFTDRVKKAAAEATFSGPALWRVTDDDTVIYLFGTVHTLRAETRWEVPAIRDALLAADAIYFEADTESSAAQKEINDIVTQRGLYLDGRTLEDVLPEEAEREVVEATDLLGIPPEGIYNFKPWLASLQLSNLHLEARAFDNALGVEKIIGADARQRGIPIRYLETGAYQLGLLASVSEKEQIAMLVQTARQIEDQPDFLETLIAGWVGGDVSELARLIAEDDVFGSGEVYNLMLRTRNANWATKIKALLEEEAGTFFVAVGAAHLAGDDSLQNILAAKGVKAERENPKAEMPER